MKKAIITGITGQSGSYLAELLLDKGYEVHGLVRRSSAGYGNLRNIIHLVEDRNIYRTRLFLHAGDMADASSINRIIRDVEPDEFYNLAAQADVMESFFMPEYSVDINAISVIKVLEAIKNINPKIKMYQASTSELFGKVLETPQNEETPFNPQSPYSFGKLAGYYATRLYRESYKMFTCNGILFNHESERRGDDYLTRKVTKAVARIKYGLQENVRLGNLDAKRDWGYAPDYMEAVYLMMQQKTPDDFVIATGETHTVKEWVEACFDFVDLKAQDHVIQDPRLFRPAEVDVLIGDATKAKTILHWEPKTSFNKLIEIMMRHDLETARREAVAKRK